MEFPHWDAEMMLRRYIYDYMVRKNLHASAEVFKEEAKVPIGPVEATNDSSWGFLLEWWSIFSDVYFTRQSIHGVQQAFSEAPSFCPNNQAQYSKVLESTGSSSKKPWLETQKLQPNMTLPKASPFKLGGNSFLHDYPIRRIQQIKPEQHLAHRFVGLDEKWVKRSNFLKGVKEDLQSTSIRINPPSNPETQMNVHVQHAEMRSPQQMNFRHPRLVGSHPTELYALSELKIPTMGFHDAGFHLNANKNKLSGWPLTGIGSTSINMEHRGLGPLFMPPNQVQQHKPFTRQGGQNPMQGSHAPILTDHSQILMGNRSDQIGSSTQKDKEKVTESVKNENTRKRKEPSQSGSEEDSRIRDIEGLSKIASPSPASSSRTLTESYGEAALAEKSNPMDESVNVKEGSRGDNAESLPSIEDASNENNVDRPSSMAQQDTLNENKDDRKDQNKLGSWPLTGINPNSTSTNMKHQGLGPLYMPLNKVQQIQPLTGNCHVKDPPMLCILGDGLNKRYSQKADGNCSEQIGLLTQKDPENVTVPVEDKTMESLGEKDQLMGQQSEQSTRKREQKSHSGSEDNSGSREITGPSKITSPSPASPSQEASSSRTSESYGEAALVEKTKPIDESVNLNEDLKEDNAESLPSTEDAHNENNEDKPSSMAQ